MHASEVPFTFKADEVLIGKGEPALATAMVDYWTNLARSANVNEGVPGPATWPPFENSTVPFLQVAYRRGEDRCSGRVGTLSHTLSPWGDTAV